MIHYANDGKIARITLDRDAPGNKLTLQMVRDVISGLEAATASGVPYLVIDSAQADFTCGRDQTEKVDLPRKENLSLILRANELLRHFPGTSISLIRGRALGFGAGMALHSTIALAEKSARFGFDEVHHGLAPLIVIAYLPYFIPAKAARELALTGREIDAAEALQLGMVSRLVEEGSLETHLAETIAQLDHLHSGAVKLIRKFSEQSSPYPARALLEDGVAQLAGWIEAGKPL